MNTLTSGLLSRHALEPAMDAQAHNAHQAALIHDPSPAVDSLVELLREGVKNALAMARMLSDLAASNGLELDCERIVAGFADDVTATLRYCERNTTDGPLSGRDLAAQLAVHLDALAADPVGHDGAQAITALRELFNRAPRHALFADTVIHHLRPRRARALEAVYTAWENRRAARDARRAQEAS